MVKKVELLVKCPECGNTMKTKPRVEKKTDISEKSKKCVYCGRSFKIHPSIDNSRIVKHLS